MTAGDPLTPKCPDIRGESTATRPAGPFPTGARQYGGRRNLHHGGEFVEC